MDYKEKLEEAKRLYELANDDQKHVLESLFPELPELTQSEDERIRKNLITFMSTFKHPLLAEIERKEFLAWLEKQGEQKTADEVEPKFHKGDWITNGDYTWKIVQVKPLDYILQSQDGNIVDDTISHVDEQFHSFTIQDAKEGDVLALSYAFQNYILIYKGLHEKDFDTMMSVFCFYYVEENTYEDETDSFHAMNRGEIITPATKKQRDILIKAMNGAGYTFDFETKELKKIDTYCQENCKGFQETGRCFCDGECKAKKEYIEQNLQKNNFPQIEQKPAWSKNDDYNVQCLIAKVTYDIQKGNIGRNYKLIDWLKSLKYRMNNV